MKWKALALLVCLAMGALLVACGPDSPVSTRSTDTPAKSGTPGSMNPQDTPISPDIPEKAASALDRYAQRYSNGEYEITSAERALHVDGIKNRWLRNIDEAWCVRISPEIVVFQERYCGPDATDCPQGPKLSYGRVLLVRRGDIWGARAVWEYVDNAESLEQLDVDRGVLILLDALGCE